MTGRTKDATQKDWNPFMIRNSFTKAAILGTVFAAAFGGVSLAQDAAFSGAWKINAASFYDGQGSLSIERDTHASRASGQFIVVEGSNVYLATGMDAHAMPVNGAKMDVANAGGKLVLVGTHARRGDFCSFKCQIGQPERKMTLRFTSVEGTEQLMGEMVAYNKK
jgi:hypothetical protein